MNFENTNHALFQNILQFDGYTITEMKDDVIRLHFREGFSIGIHDARNIVHVIENLKGTSRKCLLLVIFEEDNIFCVETREYISSDKVSSLIKADAFVIKGLALEILGKGYLKINKPKRPTRLFKSEELATSWLISNS